MSKTILAEVQALLCCLEFAQVGREPAKGVCPGTHKNEMRTVFELPSDWGDAELDAWVAACPNVVAQDAHDHRFIYRLAVSMPDDTDIEKLANFKGHTAIIAMSHYEALLIRTKEPRRFDYKAARDDGVVA